MLVCFQAVTQTSGDGTFSVELLGLADNAPQHVGQSCTLPFHRAVKFGSICSKFFGVAGSALMEKMLRQALIRVQLMYSRYLWQVVVVVPMGCTGSTDVSQLSLI